MAQAVSWDHVAIPGVKEIYASHIHQNDAQSLQADRSVRSGQPSYPVTDFGVFNEPHGRSMTCRGSRKYAEHLRIPLL